MLKLMGTPYQCCDVQCQYPDLENCTNCNSLCIADKKGCFVIATDAFGYLNEVRLGCVPDVVEDAKCPNVRRQSRYMICHCYGDRCNRHFQQIYISATLNESVRTTSLVPEYPSTQFSPIYILIPVFLIITVLTIILFKYRRNLFSKIRSLRKSHRRDTAHEVDEAVLSSLVSLNSHSINLIECIAHGRFGEVWKGYDSETCQNVAVKMFSSADMVSWRTEQYVYGLPNMGESEGILKFLSAFERKDSYERPFWLVTLFIAKGSLYDCLSQACVQWEQVGYLLISMLRGVVFLHSYIPPGDGLAAKPPIAHRDFKSKNILVKDDYSVCIGDFGLALCFDANRPGPDGSCQVGTRRYMAPEVLQGAVNFCRDSFLKMDIYALALVMWEVLSRCESLQTCSATYKLPYEKELGHDPSLQDLITFVSIERRRPEIPESWTNQEGVATVIKSIRDCWDQDADGRLSAGTVYERLLKVFTPSTAE